MSTLFEITNSTDADKNYIGNAIVNYNAQKVPFTQKIAFEEINYVVRNEKDEIIAGINSTLYCWGILYIDILWVNDHYRSLGVGSQLIQKVQETAQHKGCSLVHLDTFDFQSKDFYLKQGFEIFGVLEDCPSGHNRFYLKKKL